jgi:hypothetical protein
MLQVGERIEGHFVLFQEVVDLELGLKPKQPAGILRGQDTRPEAIQHKTFQHMTGDILPLCLDSLRNIIGQMNRDFHTTLSQMKVYLSVP